MSTLQHEAVDEKDIIELKRINIEIDPYKTNTFHSSLEELEKLEKEQNERENAIDCGPEHS